jgi:predicted nucleic acid-binding protein
MGEKPGVIIDTDILSCITQMELLIGCNNKKMQNEVEKNLHSFKILLINNQIISIANDIIKKYSFSHKMSIADNLIGATAIFYSLELYTDNKKHFDFIEKLTLFSPDLW